MFRWGGGGAVWFASGAEQSAIIRGDFFLFFSFFSSPSSPSMYCI